MKRGVWVLGIFFIILIAIGVPLGVRTIFYPIQMRDPCFDFYSINLEAIKTHNISLCLEINNSDNLESDCRIGCITKFIQSENNSSKCYNLINQTYTNLCLLAIFECGEISYIKTKDSCFYTLAVRKIDHTICGNISSRELRDNCYYGVGISTGDLNVCSEIENEFWKKECLDLAKNPSESLIHSK